MTAQIHQIACLAGRPLGRRRRDARLLAVSGPRVEPSENATPPTSPATAPATTGDGGGRPRPGLLRSVAPISGDPFATINRVTEHNIGRAELTFTGELDSLDGSVWWPMGGRWYHRSPVWPHASLVTVPSTVAALAARWAEVAPADGGDS